MALTTLLLPLPPVAVVVVVVLYFYPPLWAFVACSKVHFTFTFY
jgi:hypothetical protein